MDRRPLTPRVETWFQILSCFPLCTRMPIDPSTGLHAPYAGFLTFFLRGSRFRIVVDAAGRVIRRSTIDFGQRPLPPSLRA